MTPVGDKGFEVEGLVKRFGRTTAVDGVSPSAPRGQVLGVLGPNGAGKTLPGWLRAWADINPVTHVMNACRALLNGTPDDGSVGLTLLWSAVVFVVFCPLAVRAYGRQE